MINLNQTNGQELREVLVEAGAYSVALPETLEPTGSWDVHRSVRIAQTIKTVFPNSLRHSSNGNELAGSARRSAPAVTRRRCAAAASAAP